MSQQPEALRLADALEKIDGELWKEEAAAELRKLHEELEGMTQCAKNQDTLDAARFDWFFGNSPKTDWINTYMQGMREEWTPDQWRDAIDAAMKDQA